jgi:hypothetical protein
MAPVCYIRPFCTQACCSSAGTEKLRTRRNPDGHVECDISSSGKSRDGKTRWIEGDSLDVAEGVWFLFGLDLFDRHAKVPLDFVPQYLTCFGYRIRIQYSSQHVLGVMNGGWELVEGPDAIRHTDDYSTELASHHGCVGSLLERAAHNKTPAVKIKYDWDLPLAILNRYPDAIFTFERHRRRWHKDV